MCAQQQIAEGYNMRIYRFHGRWSLTSSISSCPPNPPRARQDGESRAFISSGAAKRQFPKNPTSTAWKVQEETNRARDQAPAAPAAAELPKPRLLVPPGPHEGSACSRKATACLRDPQVEERLGKHQRRLQFLWRRIRLERTPTASLPQDRVSESLVSAPGLRPAAHLTLSQEILLWLQEERRGCSHHTPSQGGNLDPELMD